MARWLAAVGRPPAPFVVLADDNGTVPQRTRLAGRVTPEPGLSPAQWKIFADGAGQVARAVYEETGVRTVFHHHCAGYVETPDEIATLLELTNPQRLGLVFDTGHYCYGAGAGDCDVVSALERFDARVWYIHCKDCQPEIARRARAEQWDYFTALRHGVFCELGQGGVDFPALLRRLAARGYDGYVLVEQEILPGMGTPTESARRNRESLRPLETRFPPNTKHFPTTFLTAAS